MSDLKEGLAVLERQPDFRGYRQAATILGEPAARRAFMRLVIRRLKERGHYGYHKVPVIKQQVRAVINNVRKAAGFED